MKIQMNDSEILTPGQYRKWKRKNDEHFKMREERAQMAGSGSVAFSIHKMVLRSSDENKRKAEEQAQKNWLMKRKWSQKENFVCLSLAALTLALTYPYHGIVGAGVFSVMAFGLANVLVSLCGPTSRFNSHKMRRIKALNGSHYREMVHSLRRNNERV